MTARYLIIIPAYNKPGWTTDYEEKTANELSKRHLVLVYREYDKTSLKEILFGKKFLRIKAEKKEENYYYSPIELLPFKRFKLMRKANSLINVLISFLLFRINPFSYKLVIWGMQPEVADFENDFPLKHVSLYDCVDYFDSLIKDHQIVIQKQEGYIMKLFDLVVVNSRTLYSLHKEKRKDIHLVPLGFSPPGQKMVAKKITQKKPIIGYIGAINYRLDFALLRKLIENNRNWTFIFWGPVQKDIQDDILEIDDNIDRLLSLPNVIYGQSSDRDEVYRVVKQFDICIIPYNTDFDFNKYCFPMKLFEYFYMGKPVLSSPINELKYYQRFVKIGNTVKEWQRYIKELLEKSWPEDFRSKQKEIALDCTWNNKINVILNHLEAYKL